MGEKAQHIKVDPTDRDRAIKNSCRNGQDFGDSNTSKIPRRRATLQIA